MLFKILLLVKNATQNAFLREMRHVLPSTTAVTSTVRQPAYFCQGSGAVKVEVAVLGSRPSLINLMETARFMRLADVKQH